jgi:hypothetical protein
MPTAFLPRHQQRVLLQLLFQAGIEFIGGPLLVLSRSEDDMAHFAELDENNIVLRVIVVSNADTSDVNGVEREEIGVAFCHSLFGSSTVWRQTSYNGNARKNYAGIGYSYDASLDAFLPPKPFPSWVLNEQTCLWGAPVAYPDDGKFYRWDEPTTSWIEVTT